MKKGALKLRRSGSPWLGALISLLLLVPLASSAQDKPESICRIEEGRLVIRIDLGWTNDRVRQVSGELDLDSLLLNRVLAGTADSILRAGGWEWKKTGSRTVEISRMMAPEPPKIPVTGDISVTFRPFLMDDKWLNRIGLPEPQVANYGINRFTREDVFSWLDSTAQFFLPGHTEAKQVYLSGSFNDWSTLQTPMERRPDGWQANVRLKPGKYAYKFIIDGRWTRDENNRNKEDDLNGGNNSVVYGYNYRFVLRGFTDARQVILAGSFNGFDPRELKMTKTPGGWELPLYLRLGTHAYKFIVDGKWITDPDNPVVRSDGRGNFNSFMGIGDTTWFRLQGYEKVRSMILAGSFNAWNTAELSMGKVPGGWQLPYILGPGNYEYKYIADGRWMTDSVNPFVNGEGQWANSLISVQPNHLFTLDAYPDARQVIVTGSFNGWNESSYRMVRRNGHWEMPLYLSPGKQTYKFIVDGRWITDPANELLDENEYGTGNSVLWIDR